MFTRKITTFAGMGQVVIYDERQFHYRLQPGDGTAYPFSIIPMRFQFEEIYHRHPPIHYILNITMPSVGGSVVTSPTDAWGETPQELSHNLYSFVKQHLKGVHDYTIYVMCAAFLVLAEDPLELNRACQAMMDAKQHRMDLLLKESENE